MNNMQRINLIHHLRVNWIHEPFGFNTREFAAKVDEYQDEHDEMGTCNVILERDDTKARIEFIGVIYSKESRHNVKVLEIADMNLSPRFWARGR